MNTSLKTLLFSIIAVIFIVGLIRFGMSVGSSPTNTVSTQWGSEDARAVESGGVQRITLSFSGRTHNYSPNVIHVKKGVPVELTVDLTSVSGCYTAVRIPDFNVSLNATQEDNIIRFTPDSIGRFGFRCVMGMGTGTIIVE